MGTSTFCNSSENQAVTLKAFRNKNKCSLGKCSNRLSGTETVECKAVREGVEVIRTGPGSHIYEGWGEVSDRQASSGPIPGCHSAAEHRAWCFLIPIPGSELCPVPFWIVIKT